MNRKIKLFLNNPGVIIAFFAQKGIIKISDEKFLKIMYKAVFDKKLNLDKPVTYNEKLQWLKLNDRNPIYTDMVDKYKVKKLAESKIGKKYIVPLINSWENASDINFNYLPNSFVLKTNHTSNGVIIFKDKDKGEIYSKDGKKLTITQVMKILEKNMKHDYYLDTREWPYKNVRRKIIAEEYIEGKICDYKFLCFNGQPKFVYIESGRGEQLRCNFFDMNFKPIDLRQLYLPSDKIFKKPKHFEEMKNIALKMSKDIPQLRVDILSNGESIFFGENTFYNWSGFMSFYPYEYDKILGDMIPLNKVKKIIK